MVFISMASIGLPGLNGFIGEVLSLLGMFERWPAYAVVAASGVVLAAWYMLTMVQRAFFGPLKEPRRSDGHAPRDMGLREMLAIGPIAALCLWIGVHPAPLLDLVRPGVDSVAAIYATADRPDGRRRPVRRIVLDAAARDPHAAARGDAPTALASAENRD
jgi:NADH-quinone oxidoreductase subunit M